MMSEVIKDSAVKLFGQTISQPPHKAASDESLSELSRSFSATSTSQNSEDEPPRDDSTDMSSQSINPTQEKKSRTSSDSPKKDDENSQTSQEKPTLKKPDKLIPCPRCNSMDTKFCYFNNHNLNQPRHFCKNCQRYWTSGGTMRNVPIGSGRRRSKAYPIPETLQSARASDPTNGIHIPSPNGYLISPNGFPISFYPATLYWGSAPTSPVLGKHLRGGGLIRPSNLGNENLDDEIEKSVLIPKTLRIHDPSEAAKSSIWSTLGIKNDKIGSLNGGSLFKTFVPKGDRQGRVDHNALVMKANPAALSRSVNFHETTTFVGLGEKL